MKKAGINKLGAPSSEKISTMQKTEGLQHHLNLLALFALKCTYDGSMEDFRVWTVRANKAREESIMDNAIFSCQKREGSKESCGRVCLVLLSKNQEVTSGCAAPTSSPDLSPDLVECFKIYRRLKFGPDAISSSRVNEDAIFYLNGSGWPEIAQNMIEESEKKEFIFGTKLFKFSNDIDGRKKLEGKVLEEYTLPKKEGMPREGMSDYHKGCLELDIQEFYNKAAFATKCVGLEELQALVKVLIKQHIINVDWGRIYDRLMTVVQDLFQKRHESKTISRKELQVAFEGLMTGERSNLRFGLSDPVSYFVGRERQLKEMQKILGAKPGLVTRSPGRKLVIFGLGGMGKSELAREFCRKHFISRYRNIFWINANDPEVIGICFKDLAFKELGISEIYSSGVMKDTFTVIKEVVEYLKGQQSLLVYDNAQSLHEVQRYLPSDAADVHVIITSRSVNWDGFPSILLDSFKPKEAHDLVKISLCDLPGWDDDDALVLCRELCHYPLALIQAVAYIREMQRGRKSGKNHYVQEYLKLLRESAEFVLDHPLSEDFVGGYTETTFKIVINVVEHLKKSLTGQVAIAVLNIISYLSPDHMDVDVMSSAHPKYSGDMVRSSISLLSRLSVVSLEGKNARIHRLIQAVNQVRLRNLGVEVDMLRNAMNFVLEMEPQQVLSVWGYAKEHPNLVKEFSWVPIDACEILVIANHFDTVLNFSKSALPLLKEYVGDYSSEVMKMEMIVVQSYFYLGNYAEASRLAKKYLVKWKNTSRGNDMEYLFAMFLNACMLEIQHKLLEALNAFKEIICKGESRYDYFFSCLSLSKMKIVSLQLRLGVDDEEEWKNLERFSREAYLSIRSQVEKVGLLRGWDACLSSSVKHRRIAKKMFEFFQGVAYEDISLIFVCFHQLSQKTGNLEETYEVAKWCVEILSKHEAVEGQSLPKNQGLLKHIRVHTAMLLIKMEKFEEAYDELTRLSSELRGEKDKVSIHITEMLLGYVLCSMERFEEGIPKLLKLCFNESQNAVKKDELSYLLGTVGNMLESGHHEKVSHTISELLSAMEKNVSEDEIPLYFLGYCVCMCYQLYKKYSRKILAMNLLKKVYGMFKRKFGESHPCTLRAKLGFARFYCWFGKRSTFDKGVSYMVEIKETCLHKLHHGDHQVAPCLMEVAKDLSICQSLFQTKPANLKIYTELPLGECCMSCALKVHFSGLLEEIPHPL